MGKGSGLVATVGMIVVAILGEPIKATGDCERR
jgi:hypothetical protein